MPANGQTPIPANEGHSPYFALACEIVAGEQARRDEVARRNRGVCRSGLSDDLPRVRTVEAVVAGLERQHAAREAFRRTPRGRFLRAVNSLGGAIDSLGNPTYSREAATVLNLHDRYFSDPAKALDTEAVGRCIRILADVPHPDAIAAIRALADLLSPELKAAA